MNDKHFIQEEMLMGDPRAQERDCGDLRELTSCFTPALGPRFPCCFSLKHNSLNNKRLPEPKEETEGAVMLEMLRT